MSTIRKSFPVKGMSCASCAVSVESMLKAQDGVKSATVNFADSTTLVEYDPYIVKPEALKSAVSSVGYDLEISEDISEEEIEVEKEKEYKSLRKNTFLAFLFSIPVFVLGMFIHHWEPGKWISIILTALVLFWFGKKFFVNAWKQARHKKANMDTLVALSTGIAFVISTFNTFFPEVLESQGLEPHVYFEAAAVIIAFILLGRYLEEKAKSNTSSAIKRLMGLQPKTVKVTRDGTETEILIEEIRIHEQIVIRPGEKIPVDGKVVSGSSYVDESMISGEPVPIARSEGDQVIAGTINQKGSLIIQAERIGKDTLLSQIIRMVKEAQASKAPVQRLVDKIAGIFVPAVIILAVITFILWISIGGTEYLTQAFITSVTVLIIACPCALGLATPTAIMVGVGKGAQSGILIKNSESLEKAHKVNTVVLDKTGTITQGKPEVTDILWLDGVENIQHLQNILLSSEALSEHPLAEAIVNYLSPHATKVPVIKFESITGMGIWISTQDNNSYLAGTLKLLENSNLDLSTELMNLAGQWKSEGKTVVYFADQKRLLAIISIADRIKENSAKAVKELIAQGIEVHLLTGDNEVTAKSVAEKVGISNYKAEVLPQGKADYIKNLQSAGKIVAMVGDGINDSQALAQADVGIAMAKGTDIAMDVAQITLIKSDLSHISSAIRLSRATITTIRQNLFWAFVYNMIGIPVAAGAFYLFTGFLLNPMLAGAAMALSSVSVVANSIRLKWIKI